MMMRLGVLLTGWAVLLLFAVVEVRGGEEARPQITLEVKITGLEDKWFDGLVEGHQLKLHREEGVVVLPSVTTRHDLPATLQALAAPPPTEPGVVPEPLSAGIRVTMHPKNDGKEVALTGRYVLRRAVAGEDEDDVTLWRYESIEGEFGTMVQDGERARLVIADTEEGETVLWIGVRQIDPAGRPFHPRD